jgi:hypothetical protein
MTFSLAQLIEERQEEQYSLHRQYINPSLARVQGIIGFDKIWARGQGAYLWKATSISTCCQATACTTWAGATRWSNR